MNNRQRTHSKICWYNPTNQRYYIVRRTYDLFDDLVLIKEWGGVTNQGSRIQTIYFPNRLESAAHLREIKKTRRQRGYLQIYFKYIL